jgi:hypothetical protein
MDVRSPDPALTSSLRYADIGRCTEPKARGPGLRRGTYLAGLPPLLIQWNEPSSRLAVVFIRWQHRFRGNGRRLT